MKIKKPLLLLITSFILTTFTGGCDQPQAKKTQKEIFIEAPASASMPMDKNNAFLNMMPQDDIHAGLNNTMPQDDIHAGLNMGNMPMEQSAQLEGSLDKTPLRWITPKGWLEKKGSGMRVATFVNDNDAEPVETTIISLAGGAGGLIPNITRWMGQINMPNLDNAALENFIQGQEKIKTAAPWTATLINFTQLQQDNDDSTPSMIAAVIDRDQSQIFVKMTGSKRSVLKNLDSFKSLVQSISSVE